MKYLLTFLLIFLSVLGWSQLQIDSEPEQDCINAIAVCQDTFYQPNSYSGYGEIDEIPSTGGCPGNCMLNGERNSVWYIFTVQASGNLGFVITPNNQQDDYDWAVYSLNDGYACQDIYDHVNEMQVSCNWSATPGSTGPNGNGGANCQGSGGTPFNAMIPVLSGETYVVNISNWTSSQFGYLLDYSMSTAVIYDDVRPELRDVETDNLHCGDTTLTFNFSEKVLCNTVQAVDFGFDGPGGPYTITDVEGESCDVAQTEVKYTVTFHPGIYQSGNYQFSVELLSFIQDACGNNCTAHTLDFVIDLASPNAQAGDDIEIPFLGTTMIDATVYGGSGNFAYDWQPADKLEDPTIKKPTTIPLTETTNYTMLVIDNTTTCQSQDQMTVKVVGGEMTTTTEADPSLVCSGNAVLLSANPSGGSGDFSYSWTSDPVGFTSNIKTPTVYPTVTTTYYVEVDDGYSTINDQVTVTVLPTPISDAGPDQVINVGTSTVLAGTGTNGTEPYTYAWSPGSMIDGPTDIPNPTTIILDLPQNYTLVVTDNNDCPSNPEPVFINVAGEGLSAYPQADPPEICFGESSTLNANATGGGGSYTYSWTSSVTGWSATGDNIVVTPDATTTYFVEVDDGFNTSSGHFVLAVHPLPVIDLIPPGSDVTGTDTIAVCVRDTVILDAGHDGNPPIMEYLWSNNWGDRFMIAKTNGNWFDVQGYSVQVRNPVTKCINSDEITIIFDFNHCAIGVEENITIEKPVKVYPNPNTGMFYVSSEISIKKLKLSLLTMEGMLVKEYTLTQIPSGGWEKSIDISKLRSGVYLLYIQADHAVYTQKIIKK